VTITMNRAVRISVIATAVTAAALGVAGPAAAAPGAKAKSLEATQKAVTARIDLRLAALKKFSVTLGQAKAVSAAHRSTLTALITQQSAGLTALRGKVAGEKTAAAVRADATAMVDGFRVFILTGPKVRLTAAIDTELAADAKLEQRPGADTAELTAIAAGLDGKAGTLLAITPGPDGDAIRAQVKTVRDAAKSARTALKALHKAK
jgi:hypothetical protein